MFIHWDPSLETGHTLIDAEHRMLVFLFRKLDVAVKTGESQMTVNHVIVELKRFVEFHFASEENMMREINYPHLPEHQTAHLDMLQELAFLTSKVVSHREFPEDLLFFMNKWLLEHIAVHDQHAALYLRDASARPIAEHAYGEYITFEAGRRVPE